jgi:replication fork clamp-binding protein CrfC
MSEKEFRQAGAQDLGVAINLPFLMEIKEDSEFRHLLNEVYRQINQVPPPNPRAATEMLSQLRDQLETYFALEEFYGFVNKVASPDPIHTRLAAELADEHQRLYLQFNDIVEIGEQIVYQECSSKVTVGDLSALLDKFCYALAQHEQKEMTLMMTTCNQETGVGD